MLVCGLCAFAGRGVDAQQTVPGPQPGAWCHVTGRVTSGNVPLPGVSIVVRTGDQIKAATSSDIDGRYTLMFGPSATYHLTADLTAFTTAMRDVTLGSVPCDTTVDFQLALAPRR